MEADTKVINCEGCDKASVDLSTRMEGITKDSGTETKWKALPSCSIRMGKLLMKAIGAMICSMALADYGMISQKLSNRPLPMKILQALATNGYTTMGISSTTFGWVQALSYLRMGNNFRESSWMIV